MLEKLLKDIKLQKEIKKAFAESKGIIDIILFGSVVRGKKYPQDIDLLFLGSANKPILKNVLNKINLPYQKKFHHLNQTVPEDKLLK